MVEQASVSLICSPHPSADELYKSSLDACIEGIQNFPVTKRRGSVGKCSTSDLISSVLLTLTVLGGTHFIIPAIAKRAVTSPSPVDLSGSLPSPPPSLQPQMWSSPPASSPSAAASMNRSSLHGGPTRGPQNPNSSQDARSSQHARSNFAVQPAANAGAFKLKKNTVKIVSPADPAPSAMRPQAPPSISAAMPARAATSSLNPAPLPATGLAASRFAPKE
jgi:hypothetical protein